MSSPREAPLCVLIANMLLPAPVLSGLSRERRQEVFDTLPAALKTALARADRAPYRQAHPLDVIEACVLAHLDPELQARHDSYPAWAMITAANQAAPPAHTRWWGSLGNIQLNRDGVVFTPPEMLGLDFADLQSCWSLLEPVLTEHGWRLTQAETHGEPAMHRLLDSAVPVPMEQASPWSVQGVQMTDCLPTSAECAPWRRLWHLIQMTLHEAPFNRAREARGQLPVNALWFWGGGHAWALDRQAPQVRVLTASGVHKISPTAPLRVSQSDSPTPADSGSMRLAFWSQRFNGLIPENLPKGPTLYYVPFEGWGGSSLELDRLQKEVIDPVRLAGLSIEWCLQGQWGWRQVHTDWKTRLKFWKRQTNYEALAEPDLLAGPSEDELLAAWQAGQRQQDDLMKI